MKARIVVAGLAVAAAAVSVSACDPHTLPGSTGSYVKITPTPVDSVPATPAASPVETVAAEPVRPADVPADYVAVFMDKDLSSEDEYWPRSTLAVVVDYGNGVCQVSLPHSTEAQYATVAPAAPSYARCAEVWGN
jgi:hypothetical protein